MSEETYKRVLRDGLVYYFTVPIKKAGAYQLRVALRDSTTEHVGSASQFIEVPDIHKDHLALSGLVVSGINPSRNAPAKNGANATSAPSAATAASASQTEDAVDENDPMASPAVRRFHQLMYMDFVCWIYNAKLDKATNRPQLTTQTRIFHDGQLIFEGKEIPFDIGQQTDMKRLPVAGRLRLGTNLKPGDYVFQVLVTDALAKEKYRTATQWIDFEIVQ